MKVANLCKDCAYSMPTCKSSKVVFAIDCSVILDYVNKDKCSVKNLDAVIACDGFQDERY